jgi:hypothetical protein
MKLRLPPDEEEVLLDVVMVLVWCVLFCSQPQ